ncbi:unnamed protein product [Lactuca virosa]|uniref:UBC core domain-containing protein n=1 Tax=Lactuca virosa TaxID=75947 RepID=A0AAU9M666_9ASTR|nr:unnamed protein product [Lactuca virosa]
MEAQKSKKPTIRYHSRNTPVQGCPAAHDTAMEFSEFHFEGYLREKNYIGFNRVFLLIPRSPLLLSKHLRNLSKLMLNWNTSLNQLLIKKSQVYHPNIDLDGNVCLNILCED